MFSVLGDGVPANTMGRWQPEPTARGTFSILSSCIITLGLCAWNALHLNVPGFGKANNQFWIKTGWLLCAIFAPEVVGWVAFEEWRHARKLDSFIRGTFRNREDTPPFTWSRIHSHWALMGGFAFDTGGDSSIPLPQTRYTLTPIGICFIAKHCPELMPNITTDAIIDRSKASPFAKALVLAQALWFCLQIFTRLAMKLPISALELNTLAHIFFAFCTYFAWWYKPLDAYEPVVIPLANNPTAASLCAAMYLRSTIGYIVSGGLLECSWPGSHPNLRPNPDAADDDDNNGHHAIDMEAHTPDIPAIILKEGESKQGFKFRYTRARAGENGNKIFEWNPGSWYPKTLWVTAQTQKCYDLAQESILKHKNLQHTPFETSSYEDDEFERTVYTASPDWRDDYLTLTSSNWPRQIKIGTATSGTDGTTAFFGLVISGVLYGGIHLFGWNGPLRSETELNLWRMSSLTVVAAACFVVLGAGATRLWGALERGGGICCLLGCMISLFAMYLVYPFMIGVGLYVLSRIYLVVEGFISLPFVPDEVYLQPEWSKYFPHIA